MTRSDRELLRQLKNSAADIFHLFYNYDPVDRTVQCVECGSWANVGDRMKHSPSCSVSRLFMRQNAAHARCDTGLENVEDVDATGVIVQVNDFRKMKPPLPDSLKVRVCCSSFAQGLYSGTDNEEYGSAVHLGHSVFKSESRWEDGDVLEAHIGSLQEPLSFCPFCGRELDDLPRVEIQESEEDGNE